MINSISPLVHPFYLHPNSFLSLALIRSLLNLILIVNQITLALSLLLFVLTVNASDCNDPITCSKYQMIHRFRKPDHFDNLRLDLILLFQLLLKKRFLFDVGVHCMILIKMQLMFIISFLMNPHKKVGVTFLKKRGSIPSIFFLQIINLLFRKRGVMMRELRITTSTSDLGQ